MKLLLYPSLDCINLKLVLLEFLLLLKDLLDSLLAFVQLLGLTSIGRLDLFALVLLILELLELLLSHLSLFSFAEKHMSRYYSLLFLQLGCNLLI